MLAICVILVAVARSEEPPAKNQLRIDDSLTYRLELQRQRPLRLFIDSLVLKDADIRASELQVLNQSGFTTLLDLTRFIPLRFKPEVDTFFLQNYMRPDLNPTGDAGILRKIRREPRVSVGFSPE